MTSTFSADIALILPELILAVGALALLLVGAYRGEGSSRLVGLGGMAVILVALFFTACAGTGETAHGFNDMVVVDGFGRFMKVLVLIGALVAIPMSVDFLKRAGADRFEFPVLILLATAGMMLMVSANDLITLYVGLELQSLSLYVLAAFLRDDARSTEAGLKYFVLGALSSGMLLYGCSLIYGFSGTTNFSDLAKGIATLGEHGAGIGLVVGIVFLVAGLAFKVSAVPFHMWTPDVYEGSPTPVTAFFAAAPKVAAMALFLRALTTPFGEIVAQWQQIIIFVSIASMLLGAFAAIGQTNMKRLLAYSSIGHVGYALVGLAAGGEQGIRGVLVYMAIYMVMTLGTFGVLLVMRKDGKPVESIADFAGLGRTHPWLAFVMAAFMFSLAGIPPLAGFFAKFYVFISAIEHGLYTLSVIGMLSSVVSAFYYLRVVKVMYFDAPEGQLETPFPLASRVVVTVTGAVTVLYFIVPGPLVAIAGAAAKTLVR
ncbi:NADH-quinone oxidoreductase subunit NuoN [Zavarzinia aquatilis]|uniref:NADH-quinone oxidoreductase subunit N n=1 Tax=Zavarzinia aquatilis TaxID=2211142 RepID=A0A317EGZ4_9PROT|nr:NADH-quinone oxidoreductase subunit NuoN [Zavarzinia aquatilis]PWR25584.1 NADH-quinone oxidoreductase subunit NuoN [Zavarzinia aquatilis]